MDCANLTIMNYVSDMNSFQESVWNVNSDFISILTTYAEDSPITVSNPIVKEVVWSVFKAISSNSIMAYVTYKFKTVSLIN